MGNNSKIEWTEATWNPVTGCAKVSSGCKNCYAKRMSERLSKIPKTAYYGRKFTDVQCHDDRLKVPLKWRNPRKVFVNSMSDLFHEDVPDEFIDQVFAAMALAGRHTFQVLTKRPGRMRDYMKRLGRSAKLLDTAARKIGYTLEFQDKYWMPWPIPNIWLGVSIENQETADKRIPLLLETPAAVRFLSCEPLLGAINLANLAFWVDERGEIGPTDVREPDVFPDIHWVIVGGESGPKARPMHPAWVRSIRDQCAIARVPFLFKQHGEWLATAFCDDRTVQIQSKRTVYVRQDGSFRDAADGADLLRDEETAWVGKKAAGRLLDGVLHDEYPVK
jgi:protein gp37